MGQPFHAGPFAMPMFRSFVPRRLQPWLYVCVAITFQLSGGVYLWSLNQMIGGMALMREDILMCMYVSLAGMAIYFPMLFRTKFRFTNKTLLTTSAAVVLGCNLVVPHITCLPLLWAVCFVCGMAKIQGTFECMSNIQLWMTPQRDFTVFFSWLNLLILCSIQVSDLLAVSFTHHINWTFMHMFVSGLMLIDLIFFGVCLRHVRFMRRLPLYGIDWLGAILWSVFLIELTYLLCYADWLNWWDSATFRRLALATAITLGLCVLRMFIIRHPYLEPQMWTYRHLLPVFVLLALTEALLATEYVLEEVFYEEVMHYAETTGALLDWPVLAGTVCGCAFAYWWMHTRRYNYLRLLTIGTAAVGCCLIGFYAMMSHHIHVMQLAPTVFFRGFAAGVLCPTFFVCLHEIMSFQHFFQALSVFNMIHMIVGGTLGCAVYARGLAHLVPDNMARHGWTIDRVAFGRAPFDFGPFVGECVEGMMEVSIRQIYGWAAYACLLLVLLFLLYKFPVRSTLKRIPYWKQVGRATRRWLGAAGR